ncbi:hypothetical protein AYI68_g7740 [Smittium mucronatum]|uniref:Uncharacterized protein n=1 Tax=Smittium mucronatum TaxID=133383 RepID=A0A1R0GMW0_9FUNG|nr:hypothetical protein AYI68_g7740 [Smittium mucronatum]
MRNTTNEETESYENKFILPSAKIVFLISEISQAVDIMDNNFQPEKKRKTLDGSISLNKRIINEQNDANFISEMFGVVWNIELKRYIPDRITQCQNNQFWIYIKSIDSNITEKFSEDWELSGIHTVYSNYGSAVMNNYRNMHGLSRKQRCVYGEILNEFGESFDVELTLWEYDTNLADLIDEK